MHSTASFPSVESIAFLTPLQDVELPDLGLKATFQCEVSKKGLKPEWFKGDTPLKRSDKFEMTSDNGTHTLVVDKAEAKDIGEYNIKIDGAVSTAKLTIKGMNLKTWQ